MRSGLTWWRRYLVRLLISSGAVGALVAGLVASAAPAAAAPGPAFGFLDAVIPSPEGVIVAGWAIDPDTGAAIDVHLYRNGGFLGAVRADGNRPDVEAAYPGWGAAHGYWAPIPTPEGRHTFCAYAIGVGQGAPYTLLGCSAVDVTDAPIGVLDVVQRKPGTDQVQVGGWAVDANSPDAIDVHLYVDGAFIGQVPANQYRADIAAGFPWSGGDTGFTAEFAMVDGDHLVCAYAIGVGAGAPWNGIGCKTITFTSAPLGALDTARSGENQLRVTGWSFDPDVTAPVDIHLYVDGLFSAAVPANEYRGDIGASFPAYGAEHGFGATLFLWPGARNVCAYAINQGPGPGYVGLGCKALDPMPPAGSGGGRRIVYANLSQRLWLIGADGFVDHSHPVSGKYLDPPPGTYRVYAFQRHAEAGHDGITMEYFVAFNPAGLGYGFHTIPTFADGTPLQGENELGFFRSAGCVRQRRGDAIFLWNWAQVGDPVVVLGS